MIQAIETVYNGYRFRSRLEARWAVFFDAAGIKYQYEPEGFRLSDGTLYLPDFYLPESDTFVEVKGVMSNKDMHKIEQFISDSGKAVVVAKDNLHFQACDLWGEGEFTLTEEDNSSIIQCLRCGKYYFMGWAASWACRCCGAHDGDYLLNPILDGDGDMHPAQFSAIHGYYPTDSQFYTPLGAKFRKARDKARQARFEHGETP